MTPNIWACRFSVQAVFDSQISGGYTVFWDLKDRAGFPFVLAFHSVFPRSGGNILDYTEKLKKLNFLCFSVSLLKTIVCQGGWGVIAPGGLESGNVVDREGRSNGTFYKAKEKIRVKIMDKVS